MEMQFEREFVAVAQYQNFTKAADALYQSESTVSRHIQKLEKELGVRLLLRDTHSVRLTEHGQLYLEYARRRIAVEDEFLSELARRDEAARLRVRCLAQNLAVRYGVAEMFQQIEVRHSGLRLELQLENSADVIREQLKNGACDFAILREGSSRPDKQFRRHLFQREYLALLVNAAHPLASREGVEINELRHEDMILPRESNPIHQVWLDTCRGLGYRPRSVRVGYPTQTIFDMVAVGLGCGVIARNRADRLADPQLRALALRPQIYTCINLLYTDAGNATLNAVFQELHRLRPKDAE